MIHEEETKPTLHINPDGRNTYEDRKSINPNGSVTLCKSMSKARQQSHQRSSGDFWSEMKSADAEQPVWSTSQIANSAGDSAVPE